VAGQNKNNDDDSSVVKLVGITYLLDQKFKSKHSVLGMKSLSSRRVFIVVELSIIMRCM